ncbi:MAG: hypothetical protein ABMA01_23715 [Chthoniobacteraceae bacterium]
MTDLQIICVLKAGGDYLPQHVAALKDGCKAAMPPHDFLCMTDMEVECPSVRLTRDWKGWWAKMEVFGPLLPDRPTLYLDLDTVLLGRPCAEIIAAAWDAGFVILRDVYRGRQNPHAMQSSAMFWQRRPAGIYDHFTEDAAGIMGRFRGDQDFLESVVTGAKYWQDLTLGFCSFKADVLRRGCCPRIASSSSTVPRGLGSSP